MGKSQSRLDTPVIVSIDFGTTFTGYAFTFSSKPASIYTNLGDVREPTCILLDSEQNFVAFGKQAVEMYNDLSPDVKTDYYFFNNFKMALYEPTIGRGTHRGSKVDEEFKEFLITLFGSKVLKEYQEKHTEEFFDLFRKFDVKKKSFSTDTREVTIPFDYDLVTLIKKVTGKQVHEAIALYLGSVKFQEHGRKLVLDQHTMAGFFEPTINVVIGKVRHILDVCKEDLISTLMLAGGFSESPYLREKLVSAFPKLQIIVPDEPSLAVVKGALLMGLEPKNVIQRRAQYSYGFDVSETFDPDIHPDSLKAERDGEAYCKHISDKQITKGQILTHQQVFVRKTTDVLKMTESKQMKLSAAVFRSDLETPRYCTEDGCELVGVVTMTPPPEGWPDVPNVEHQLIVGETELKIRVVDRTTGSEYESTMDFL
ncbi:heat shock 70 kDa protein 12A-like [Mya arenaria]|uniref:heat shock 70 kDa protein 12A-like n=1 Tax=Mya arenaria TaxID=6604 RepID=UPI0022E020F5|nr:heat shock 70 kDa protein 12A-like [Mya arenaria]